MVFVESTMFAARVGRYLSDNERFAMEMWLIVQPDAGALIPGSGGLRKLRWRMGGKGKRSGVRVIYCWWQEGSRIFLATIYSKAEWSDVPKAILRRISQSVQEWLDEEA
jgi:mRNA-degrading endonuclease RelE of RelBE toxin-antitoxin system